MTGVFILYLFSLLRYQYLHILFCKAYRVYHEARSVWGKNRCIQFSSPPWTHLRQAFGYDIAWIHRSSPHNAYLNHQQHHILFSLIIYRVRHVSKQYVAFILYRVRKNLKLKWKFQYYQYSPLLVWKSIFYYRIFPCMHKKKISLFLFCSKFQELETARTLTI